MKRILTATAVAAGLTLATQAPGSAATYTWHFAGQFTYGSMIGQGVVGSFSADIPDGMSGPVTMSAYPSLNILPLGSFEIAFGSPGSPGYFAFDLDDVGTDYFNMTATMDIPSGEPVDIYANGYVFGDNSMTSFDFYSLFETNDAGEQEFAGLNFYYYLYDNDIGLYADGGGVIDQGYLESQVPLPPAAALIAPALIAGLRLRRRVA